MKTFTKVTIAVSTGFAISLLLTEELIQLNEMMFTLIMLAIFLVWARFASVMDIPNPAESDPANSAKSKPIQSGYQQKSNLQLVKRSKPDMKKENIIDGNLAGTG